MSSASYHDWMTAALEQAEKSWSEGGIPIGSVLVSPAGEIVARGHNERVQSGDPTAHAEIPGRPKARAIHWRNGPALDTRQRSCYHLCADLTPHML